MDFYELTFNTFAAVCNARVVKADLCATVLIGRERVKTLDSSLSIILDHDNGKERFV